MNGYVIYSLDNFTANKMTSAMLHGMPIPNNSLLVKSAVSEICNIICGKAITILANEYLRRGIEISTPIYLNDAETKIYKKDIVTLNVPLTTHYGMVALSLGFE